MDLVCLCGVTCSVCYTDCFFRVLHYENMLITSKDKGFVTNISMCD